MWSQNVWREFAYISSIDEDSDVNFGMQLGLSKAHHNNKPIKSGRDSRREFFRKMCTSCTILAECCNSIVMSGYFLDMLSVCRLSVCL